MEGPKKVPEYKEATKVASYKGHTIHNEPFKHQGAGAQRFVVRDKRGAKSGPSHSSLKNAKDEIDMWNK
jgi:hypothetical protein